MASGYCDGGRQARGSMPLAAVEAAVAAVETVVDLVLNDPAAQGPQPIHDVVVASLLRAVPTAQSVSTLLLDRRRRAVGGSASDGATASLDEAQVALGEGPVLEVGRSSSVAQDHDLRRRIRWPRWTLLALGAGHESLVSVPLRTRDSRGAITLFGTADAFAGPDVLLARLVAGVADTAVDNVHSVDGLTRALETRDVIGQAKGILQERFSLDDRAAFALLVESSQDTNVKLREVASMLADGTLAERRRC